MAAHSKSDAPRQQTALWVLLFVAVIVAIVTITLVTQPGRTSASKIVNKTVTTQTVTILRLNGAVYLTGSADHMAHLEAAASINQACRYWSSLTEPEKVGLAFVDSKVVPRCAPKRYVATAKAQLRRRPQSYYSNGTSYYDLGHPVAASYYPDEHYSCGLLKSWTQYDYSPPSVPRLSDQLFDEQLNGMAGLTPSQVRKVKAYNQAEKKLDDYRTSIQSVEDMYSTGGTFDKNCYPPGAIFGGDDSVTFYPNHPVASITEAAAPVFYGPGGSNLIGVGHPYVIKPGDTPSSVATQFYDDWSQFTLIVAANNIAKLANSPPDSDSPYTIVPGTLDWAVGQTIYLPDSGEYTSS